MKFQIPRTPNVWQSVKWLSTGNQILSRGMKGRRGLTSALCTRDGKDQRTDGSAWLTILTKHLEAMTRKKTSKEGFNTCCSSQTGKWEWKDKQGWHCGPVCPSHKTNCAHGNLLDSMDVSHSEAIYGWILHTGIYFDKLNFLWLKKQAMAVQYINIKINILRSKYIFYCFSHNLQLNNVEWLETWP